MKEFQNKAILASAGSGKTYQLVTRYISLLNQGVRPEEIVALTFTRNAAGEIFERIIERLLTMKDNQLSSEESISYEKRLELLRTLIHSMHKLQIGTLDSFFVKIIKLFAFEFGLPGKITIVDERMQSYIREFALKKALSLINSLNDKKAFIEDFKKATFGKEEKRVFESLNDYINDYQEFYLLCPEEEKWGNKELIWPDKNSFMFEQHAPETLKRDLENALNANQSINEKQKKKIMDLAEIAIKIEFNPNINLNVSSNDFEKFFEAFEDLRNGMAEIKVERKNIKFPGKICESVRKILEHIARVKIEKKFIETKGIFGIIKLYEKVYDSLIRANGIITFADLPFLLAPNSELGENHYILSSLSSDNDHKLYIDYRLDAKFNHWLLDEFQDTSLSQWLVIENLIDELMQDISGSRSFFFVGDAKQAIYGWRGGVVELFEYVMNLYKDRVKTDELTLSRRSCPQVITAVNKVFGSLQNLKFLPEKLKAKWKFSEHKPRPEGKNGYATLLQLHKVDDKKKKETIEQKAGIISEIITQIQPFERKLSVAVLCRRNDYAKNIAEELRSKVVPAIYCGENNLAYNSVVVAFLSLFKFAEHPSDNFAWEHLRMTPFKALLGDDREKSALFILKQVHDCGFVNTIRYWKKALESKVGVQFDKYNSKIFDQFLEAAGIFDSTGEKSCSGFNRFINDYSLPDESIENAVQCMTIHKAKGLEFDIVFLPELWENNKSILKSDLQQLKGRKDSKLQPKVLSLLPERMITQLDSSLKEWVEELDISAGYENLCVLYVAMTRAREALYMIADPPKASGSDCVRYQDILIAALANKSAGNTPTENYQILYEEGSKNWYEEWQEKSEAEKQGAEDDTKSLIAYNNPELETLKPSTAGVKITSSSIARIFEISDIPLQIGTIVHYMFEKIEWIETADVEKILTETRSELKNTFDADLVEESVNLFQNALNSCEIRKELSKPTQNCELWREKSFSIILEGKLINGQFDRVTILKDESNKIVEAVILDYKTDKVSNEMELNNAIEHHRVQLELYRKVLSRLIQLPEDKISAKIAFTSCGVVKSSTIPLLEN